MNVCITDGYKDAELQEKLKIVIDKFIFEYVRRVKGSVSAEHGVGLQKADYLKYSKTPEMITQMKLIKNVFDPNGIMNPYKVLPDHI